MKLLLDTCTLIWLTSDPIKLSNKITLTIDDQQTTLFLSDTSVWEICLKWQTGKLKLPDTPRLWIEAQCNHWEIKTIPIIRSHLFRVSELPVHHRDPFDRLLVAQSIEEGLTIATPDEHIQRYPVSTLW